MNTFHPSPGNSRNAEEVTENAVAFGVLRRKLSNKLGRILWIMKLIGACYGDTVLNEGPRESSNCCSRFYCMVVLLGQWLLVFVVLTPLAIVFGGSRQISSIFWLMIGGIWCLQNAIVTTLSLYVFPKRRNKSSRFDYFINSLLSNSTTDGLKRVKTKTVMKRLAFGCFISTVNSVSIVLLDLNQEYSIARYQPWNGNIVCHFFTVIFGALDSFTWTVPFCLFCVSCALLEGMFDNLLKKVPMARDSHHILSIASLRKEHQKLCETVAMANKVFSPFLLVEISLDIPLLCIDFNELVQLPRIRKENLVYVIAVLYWCTVLTGRLAVVLWFAMRVNEKVSHRLTCRPSCIGYKHKKN